MIRGTRTQVAVNKWYLDASADGFHDLRDQGLGLPEALAAGEEVTVVVAAELADDEQRPRQAIRAPARGRRGAGGAVAEGRSLEPPEPRDLRAEGAPERRHADRVAPEEEPHVQRRAADDGEVGAVGEVLRLPRQERRQERKPQRLRCACVPIKSRAERRRMHGSSICAYR